MSGGVGGRLAPPEDVRDDTGTEDHEGAAHDLGDDQGLVGLVGGRLASIVTTQRRTKRTRGACSVRC